MCDTCGCGDHALVPLEIHEKILAGNDALAQHNREHFSAHGVLAINLMGSPGSGKTAVLEATSRRAGGRWKLAAVSGDLATDNDAQRLAKAGIPALSITTGSACHLDARLVHDALHDLAWDDADMLFIENVGNLVCPAIYDLGEHANVVALSITEGDDKPLKYPVMFKAADLVLITKVDLLPHLPGVSLSTLRENLAQVMPQPAAIEVSSVDGTGLTAWLAWLEERRVAARAGAISGGAHQHHAHDHHSPHAHDPHSAPAHEHARGPAQRDAH